MFSRRIRWQLAAAVVAISLGLASAQAGVGNFKVIPPKGTGGQKEVDPPVIPPVIPPPTHNTPEPGTLALAVLGGASLAAWRRKRKQD